MRHPESNQSYISRLFIPFREYEVDCCEAGQTRQACAGGEKQLALQQAQSEQKGRSGGV